MSDTEVIVHIKMPMSYIALKPSLCGDKDGAWSTHEKATCTACLHEWKTIQFKKLLGVTPD